MSTYGDRYVFAFETTGASKAARDMATIAKNAAAAATALDVLAIAWRNYAAATSSAGPSTNAVPKASLKNVQIVSSGSGSVVNAPQQIVNPTPTQRAPTNQRNPSGLPFGQTGLSRYAIFWAEGFAINTAIRSITAALEGWATVQKDMDAQQAQFAVSLRGGRYEIEKYRIAVLDMSRETGIPFAELGPGLTTQMRVKGAPQDLALRAAQVQRVTGVDNLAAERDLLALSKQFPDKSLVQILDAFSAAMRRSSLQADEFFGMLESAGPLSKQFNTSMETIFGIFAGVSTVAGESGSSIELFLRQMERVYTEVSTRSVVEKYVGPVSYIDKISGKETRRPIEEIFSGLSQAGPEAIQEVAVTIPNMLGQQTRQLFMSMMSEWKTSIEDATQGAKLSSGEWNENVKLVSKTWNAEIQSMEAAWNRFLLTIAGSDLARTAVKTTTEVLDYAALKGESSRLQKEYRERGGTRFDALATDPRTGLRYAEQDSQAEYERQFRRETGMIARPSILQGGTGQAIPEFYEWKIKTLLAELQAMQNAGKIGASASSVAGNAGRFFQQYPALSVAGDRGRFFQPQPGVPAMTPEQMVTLPAGMNAEMLKKLTDKIVADAVRTRRESPQYDAAGNVSYPYRNMTDQAIKSELGLDTVTPIAAVDEFLRSLGNVKVVLAAVNPAIQMYAESIKETKDVAAVSVKVTRDQWNRVTPGKFGVDSTFGQKVQEEYDRLREGLIFQGKQMSGAWSASDEEILKSIGIVEEHSVVVDAQSSVLQKATIDANLYAVAVGNTSAALQDGIIRLSYFEPPEWMSDSEYITRLQTGANRNMAIQRREGAVSGPGTTHTMIAPGGTAFTVSGVNEEALQRSTAEIARYASKVEANTAKQKQLAEESNSKLEQIRESMRGFAAGLLQPTQVTPGQIADAKVGRYKDQWDEPARKVRDVMDRAVAMNPNLGPWKGFAQSVGVDTTNANTIAATGAEFERKFYSGQMGPDFYEKYSKEAFIEQARGKLAEMEGRKGLEDQALGWLKEAGLDSSLSGYFAKEFAGTISPAESFIRGGKDNAALIKDISSVGEAGGTGLLTGMASKMDEKSPLTEVIAAFDMDSDESKTAVQDLGKAIGTHLITGMGQSIKDGLISEIYKRVMESIDLEGN